MKTSISGFLSAMAFMALMFYGCTKSIDSNSGSLQSSDLPSSGKHVYGLLPMTPDQYLNIPLYSMEAAQTELTKKGLTVKAAAALVSPPVRDQGQIGSCTAFCGAETFEILLYYKNQNTNWASTTVLSPAYIYYCERVKILKQKITADNGAYMVNIPQALQTYGDCTEALYQYPSSNKSTAYKTAPSAGAVSDALTRKIVTYSLLAQGDVAQVKAAITSGKPVMMGFNVYDTSSYTLFEGLNTSKYVYNPLTSSGALVSGARLLGGHAVPIIGYNDTFDYGGATTGAFYVQNSWGTSWGQNGYFWLPYPVYASTKIVPAGGIYVMSL
jgi:hypothetical protein